MFILGSNVFYAISPRVLKLTIDKIEAGIEPRTLLMYCSLLVAIAFGHLIFRFFMRTTMISASRKIEYDIRNDYFSHLLTLPISFYHNYKTGDLMARATNDLNAVRNVVGPGIMHSTSNIMMFVFVIALMAYTSFKLTLFALIPLPLITLVSKLTMKHIYATFKKAQEQYSTITAKVQENISGVRVVKAYVQEDRETQIFSTLNDRYLELNLKLTKIRSVLFASISLFMGIALAVLIWVGGKLVMTNTISVGDFVAFTVWLGMLAWPLISFGWILNMIQQGAASLTRIAEILDIPPAIRDNELTDKSIRAISGEIEFRDVSFRFPNTDADTLRHINLKIPHGTTLAVVGHTGSGKSTFANLIPRLFEPTDGHLLIDGRDIISIPLKTLRKHIGMVPQETFLFSDTIAENISFGVDTFNGAELEAAASLSTIAHDLDKFPDKYETLLGERGITLSGGQKQRTALSRAIIRKPSILILDDAFSSVDSNTEEQILHQFRDMLTDQTIIIVAHRISTIMHADHIIVLDDGEIIEQGTHNELLAMNGFYARLFEKQRLEADLETL